MFKNRSGDVERLNPARHGILREKPVRKVVEKISDRILETKGNLETRSKP